MKPSGARTASELWGELSARNRYCRPPPSGAVHRVTPARRVRPPRLVLGVCRVDKLRIAEHPRCARCTCLVGDGHYELELVEGGICGGCAAHELRAARRAATR